MSTTSPSLPGSERYSEYTRSAVPLNIAVCSSSLKPVTSFWKTFHATVYDADILSTGKLLSNMHRSGPKHSIMCSYQRR